MIDLSNPDTYSIQDFGGGSLLYRETSTGLFFDPSDLSTPLSSADVQAYGAPVSTGGAISPAGGTTSSQSAFNAPAPSPTANSASSGGLNMSGLGGLFTAVGSAFASVINPPKTTKGGQPLVYDAIRGAYIPAQAAGQSVTQLSSIPMWVVIGVVVIGAVIVLRTTK
jgi:hypothetical protein